MKISKDLTAESEAKANGKEFIVSTTCADESATSRLRSSKIQTVFLPRFPRLFCLLSSRILQNNLLDLYFVEIRRYKLSFFAKEVTKTPHSASAINRNFPQFLKDCCVKLKTPPGAGTRHIIG